MANFDSIQNQLQSSVVRSLREVGDAAGGAGDGATAGDIAAFNEAMQRTAVTTSVCNQQMLMKHNLTKSIIDGMQ